MNKDFVNESIYARKVILIDEKGTRVGETFKNDAIKRAKDVGLDLVQMGDDKSGFPICKILDYGKMKYEKSKVKLQKPQKEKEIMFHVNTSLHDIETKINHARDLISKGIRVKFGIEMRKRERYSIEDIKDMVKNQVVKLTSVAKYNDIVVSDRSVYVVLQPNK